MANMKTASTLISLIAIVTSLVYGWLLLRFINASDGIWAAWVLSITITLISSILVIWARDEYFKAEFQRIKEMA